MEKALAARASLRQAIPPMVDHIWKEAQSEPVQSAPFKASAEGEAFYQQVQELQPTNDMQRGLKQRIIEVALDLAKARLLLFSHLGSSIRFLFLAVLLLWMTILFAGFSLMAPPNTITLASLIDEDRRGGGIEISQGHAGCIGSGRHICLYRDQAIRATRCRDWWPTG